ncbi:CRISPR-associated protein Cas4 [Archaeoglobales archaeon]|nr:MAG: CRISPR-associated protein Cas4 [Archaeoglobales archaeon]
MISNMYIRGTQVNYYFVCKTKLWLFSHNITMEKEHELVKLGKLIHDSYYERDQKDVTIGPVAFDVIRKNDEIEIREVKKSGSFEKAHEYQLLYYIYYLNKLGIKAKGILSYPKQRKTIKVKMDSEKEKEIEKILSEIEEITKGKMPQPSYAKHCRKCAYFELCFA